MWSTAFQAEAQVVANITRASPLRQSTLRKAFNGGILDRELE